MIFFIFFFAVRCPFFCSQFRCCFMWFIELHTHSHTHTCLHTQASLFAWPRHIAENYCRSTWNWIHIHNHNILPLFWLNDCDFLIPNGDGGGIHFAHLFLSFSITFLLIKSKLRYTPVILNAVLSIQYFVLRSLFLHYTTTKVIHIFPSWNTFSSISAFEYYGLRYYFIYCCRRQPTTNNAIQQKCIGLAFHKLATQPNSTRPPKEASQQTNQRSAQFHTFGRSRTFNDSVNLIECLARAQLLLLHRSNITKSERNGATVLANWMGQQKITVG